MRLSPRAPGRRRLLPLALAALGAVALLAVLGLRGTGVGWLGGWLRDSPDEPTSEELAAAVPSADAPAHGPTLLARETAKTRETHGPVTVSVVDPANGAVEGVRVVAIVLSPPDADGQVRQESGEQAFTDALGRARFTDLPYDGRATVAARARAPGDEAEVAVTNILSPEVGKMVITRWDSWGVGLEGTARPPSTGPHREGLEGEASTTADGTMMFTFAEPVSATSFLHISDGSSVGGLALAEAQVTGPKVSLSLDRGLPLHLEVREGGGGRLRPDARWQVRPRLAWSDDAYGAATLPLTRGEAASVTCRVEAPKGFVAQREAQWDVFVHPRAQRLVAVCPLRPALDVLVLLPREVMPYRVEDFEGSVTVAGITLESPDLHVDAQGRLRVRGGAHVMGDTVEVNGTLAKRFQVSGRGFIGPDPRLPVLVEVTVTPLNPVPDPSPGGGGAFESMDSLPIKLMSSGATFGATFPNLEMRLTHIAAAHGGDLQAWMQVAAEKHRLLEASRALLPVRVAAWDGRPAAGALVFLGNQRAIADAQGRATFRDVPVGTATIVVLGAGASTTVPIEVGPAPRSEAMVTALAGATLEVEVVDSQGRPLPYAQVDVTQDNGQAYMDCVDGVQRLDPYTDELGRRIYRAVAPGTVKVRAAFGTRSSEGEIKVVDGGREVLRLELPVHAPPPPPLPPVPPETDGPAAK